MLIFCNFNAEKIFVESASKFINFEVFPQVEFLDEKWGFRTEALCLCSTFMNSLFVSDLVFLFQDNEDVKASVLRDAEQAQKLFLQRLFPVEMKDITAKSSHKDWLEELASKVEHSKVLASRKEVAKELQQKEIKGSSEELEKLEGQVKHYKSVLDETVSF